MRGPRRPILEESVALVREILAWVWASIQCIARSEEVLLSEEKIHARGIEGTIGGNTPLLGFDRSSIAIHGKLRIEQPG